MLVDVNIQRNLTRRVTVNKLLIQVTWKKKETWVSERFSLEWQKEIAIFVGLALLR